jgi:prepilin-type N-terminal cleavage/methylation domain-containing protein
LSSSRGFTLIELLMVVVIIGLLAAVLVPKFANSREKAFVATLKSDLRNLAAAQESYFFDNGTYTGSVSLLTAYRPSTGVSISFGEATMGGWSATAKHPNSLRDCYLFVGNAAPIGTATQEGQVSCQ